MTHAAYNTSANMHPDAEIDAMLDVMSYLDETEYSFVLSCLHDMLNSTGPTSTPLPLAEQDFTELDALLDDTSFLDVTEYSSVLFCLHDMLNSTSPTPLPLAEQLFNVHSRPVERQSGMEWSGGYGGFTYLGGAAPHSFGQPNPFMATQSLNVGQVAPVMQAGPLYCQPYSQGQFNNPVLQIPEGLQPVAYLNEVPVYDLPIVVSTAWTSAAAPLCTKRIKREVKREKVKREKVKREEVKPEEVKPGEVKPEEDDQPYIRKPPNAFMLFVKEYRPKFQRQLRITGTAAVNKILGGIWKSLSKEEQDKYYQEADRQKRLHEQQYPDWSAVNNYGRKRKRKPCVKPAYVMEAPHHTLYAHPQTPLTTNVYIYPL